MNTLSSNNVLILETFLAHIRDTHDSEDMPVILTIGSNFPSDDVGLEHALQVVLGTRYQLVKFEPRHDGLYDFDQLIEFIKIRPGIKLGFFPGLCYVTGQRFPIERITAALHQAGAIAGFDLAHAAGNFKLSLHDWNVDFATFCGYKYMNGGPGAVGGIFVHERWFTEQCLPKVLRVSGWFGIHRDDRFSFDSETYRPAPGAWSFVESNDQIFNMLGVEAWFDLVETYGWDLILKKNEEISSFLYECLATVTRATIVTPEPYAERGCQISFKTMRNIDNVMACLSEKHFVEKRGKDIIRVTAVAYNSFEQVWNFCKELAHILEKMQ